ncbi:NrfD/PsrC family molybdoenzyme membrane anchor subunit [Geoalkalibacter halelectricus]|uniref:Polysulfide reductase NrfD n=1 Tax=Geoalkalibacter halelectricus TaxID=2847045 RepID=A0ABY5ZFR9_9BACT|nr:NrfD/PsrC family molybdoenzyme membrane anchor subunit [Geoalkalibacter halelectricus]MDO3378167.1 polysulfide reductase NrfD [Geoalkalibacter halelectricus]UWZ78013.1 polysulfide reductase NrfD [Geoalkalibacter halelectricus]
MYVHGEIWTAKEMFVLPNEFIYWSIQIVMYPFMTGLVAGAFVLSSLYHVFGFTKLKDIARFSLVFSFALLPVAMMPLMLHLSQPLRGINVLMTPHFTSAISAFGIVFLTYACIVASELWFVYRKHFVDTAQALKAKSTRTTGENLRLKLFSVLTLGAWDVSPKALEKDHKAVTVLAAIGIPVACFLHGYAGFIFGSVKANALWMTPLMPVIFICSAVVSGIALCILCYIATMEIRKFLARRKGTAGGLSVEQLKGVEAYEVRTSARYLLIFMILAVTLELLDIIFRGYTAVKSWEILRSVIYEIDFFHIFILQFGLGNLVPFILLLIPRLTVRRAAIASALVLFGVFMMRWNVVIGGQAFSLTFAGFMHYHLPIIPTTWETFREGLAGALLVITTPFVLFYFLNKIFPVFLEEEAH